MILRKAAQALLALALSLTPSNAAVDIHARTRFVLATDDRGVDPTGAAASHVAINRLLAGGNLKIEFPCGTFVFASTLKIYSGTEIVGRGDCTVLKLSSAMSPAASNYKAVLSASVVPSFGGATIENADYTNGNSNITIRNLRIDGTALLPQAMHVMAFYKVNGLTVENVLIDGLDASNSNTYTGIAAVNSTRIRIVGNRTTALVTGVGVWDGSSKVFIAENSITGGSTSKAQNGIVVNGIATNYAVNTTDGVDIVNNSIVGFHNATATGIDATGLCYSQDNQGCASGSGPFVYGALNNAVISGNTISDHGGVAIRAGEGSRRQHARDAYR